VSDTTSTTEAADTKPTGVGALERAAAKRTVPKPRKPKPVAETPAPEVPAAGDNQQAPEKAPQIDAAPPAAGGQGDRAAKPDTTAQGGSGGEQDSAEKGLQKIVEAPAGDAEGAGKDTGDGGPQTAPDGQPATETAPAAALAGLDPNVIAALAALVQQATGGKADAPAILAADTAAAPEPEPESEPVDPSAGKRLTYRALPTLTGPGVRDAKDWDPALLQARLESVRMPGRKVAAAYQTVVERDAVWVDAVQRARADGVPEVYLEQLAAEVRWELPEIEKEPATS